MLELPVAATRLVAYGAGGYLVPRADGRTYVGATMEDVGFDAGTTPDGAQFLRGVAGTLAPALRHVPPSRHAAALRPMTPDHLPVLGPDPADPSLWYACGHGRNGILLAPLTGQVVADALTGHPPGYTLDPFSVTRFQ
jgi:glycine oxidase